MTEYISICPDCSAEYETTERTEQLPLQRLDQQCPSCGDELAVGIVNYPSGTYAVGGPALDGEPCANSDCSNAADLRIQWVGEPVRPKCELHHVSLFELARNL